MASGVQKAHMIVAVKDYRQNFAATQEGVSLRHTSPQRFAIRLNDVEAIAEHARCSSFHDLRRMGKKALRKLAELVLPDCGDPFESDVEEDEGGIDVGVEVGASEVDSDSFGDDDSVLEVDEKKLVVVKDTNSLNRSLLGVYQKSGAAQKVVEVDSKGCNEKDTVYPTHADNQNTNDATEVSGKGESIAHAKDRIRRMREANGTSKRRKQNGKKDSSTLEVLAESSGKYDPPSTRLDDLGGIESCIEDVLQLIGMPLKHPEVYSHLGIAPPRGILLHGPPGCGKSMLANAIAGESQVPFIQISAPSVVSGMSGESEKKIREIFEEAKTHAPCILFIDEIDAITPKRETAQREMERRIVAQLLTCMDGLSLENTNGKPVLVIGATNRPDSLDPALRRAGRFDREISMGVPDETARMKILQKLCSKLRLEGEFDYRRLAKETPGYVGADLNALTTEAGMVAVRRIFRDLVGRTSELLGTGDGECMEIDAVPSPKRRRFDPPNSANLFTEFLSGRDAALASHELENLSITHDDFVQALKKVQPSSKREGFATVPDVTWDHVGALDSVRDELRMSVVEPIKHPDLFKTVGIVKPTGVLLYGPPGCGKTMLAKAVASESCCNFISVKGPELLNKYVGESERGVRTVFARAASSAPCVIFFDELDALCPSRSSDAESQSSSRLVNTLLTEMDGMSSRTGVYIIGATNRPDMIDPAILRPGRLDKTLYVDLPTAEERCEILKTILRGAGTPIDATVRVQDIAEDARCDGFSGADLAALVREAAVAALRGNLFANLVMNGSDEGSDTAYPELKVTMEHFGVAFTKMAASVSRKERRKYELLKVKFSGNLRGGDLPSNHVEGSS